MARLVLSAGVPVVPVGMLNTQFVRSRIGIPTMRRPEIHIGPPLDFSAYAEQHGFSGVMAADHLQP